MAGIFPWEAEFLLAYYKMVLAVMHLQIFITAAVNTAVHVALQYFLSFRFPVGVE